VAKDVPGFIVNRVARNFYLEAMRIVMEGGATLEQVDVLMRSAGFKMGPFELMDVIGLDVNFAVTLSVWEQYFREPRFAPAQMQHEYVSAGLLGKKTGEGFYKYSK
jgi:3-hydroxybutyryl-CoA dehydrogenase